jgi:alkylation response protein AidB-like acyl-CoA dehydrogenase
MTGTATLEGTDLLAELDAWLEANWDPDLTVGEWWELLGLAGWSAPSLPEGSYGRGVSRNDSVRVAQRITEFGALGAPAGLGLLLAAPTIAAHGTREQIDTYVRDIVTGQQAWCQLFSEPGAGSDLAGLQTRAVLDGDEWVVNGQKVWTSGGQHADYGMLLARTDPDAPKHQGITYFAFPMHQPGVEVRPLREMTGRALFNEVFMTDARVSDGAVIGGVNRGWGVANTTLMNERAGLGSGGGSPVGGAALPGTVAGHLGLRVGDLVRGRGGDSQGEAGVLSAMSGASGVLRQLAATNGAAADPMIRQDLARLYTLGELGRFNALRLKAVKQAGGDIAGMPNIAKLSMSQIMRLSRDLGLRIAGAGGMLHAYDAEDRATVVKAAGSAMVPLVTEVALLSPAPPIYGGTDQIQRNIIGERVLGLPKEPGVDRDTPFSQLPRNA